MPELNRNPGKPAKAPEDWVTRILAGQTFTGTILSSAVWSVMTHWNSQAGPSGRSQPCYVPQESCAGCIHKIPKRWKGYLHMWKDGRPPWETFLEISPGLDDKIADMFPNGVLLRGQRIQVSRGKGDKAHLSLVCMAVIHREEFLPQERDPQTVLETLWGMPVPTNRGGRKNNVVPFNEVG